MKQVYDVIGSTTLRSFTPRVVQVHLKSHISLPVEEVIQKRKELLEDETETMDTDLRQSLYSILAEGESLRGTKKVGVRKTWSFNSVESLDMRDMSNSDPSNNLVYWLAFPSAMRMALLSSKRRLSLGRNFRESDIPNDYLNSMEELGITNEHNIRMGSVCRRNSLPRIRSSRKGHFQTDLPLRLREDSGGVYWPKGEFNKVSEKRKMSPLHESEFKIEWKDQSENAEVPPAHIPKVKERKGYKGVGAKHRLNSSINYSSDEVRTIYGNYPGTSTNRKYWPNLLSKCFT